MGALEIKNYSNDALKYIDSLTDRTEYTALEVFDNNMKFLDRIEGEATGGTLSVTNQSSVRRSGSLNLLVPEYGIIESPLDIMHEVTNMETLISMNKIVRVWKGIEDTFNMYPAFAQEGKFWFNMGTFLMSNASVTYNNQGIQVSLKLNDKMARLNGEAGGTIASEVQHSPLEEMNSAGQIETTLPRIKDIVTTLLKDFGALKDSEYGDGMPAIEESYNAVMRWEGTGSLAIQKTTEEVIRIARAPVSIPSGWTIVKSGEYLGYKKLPLRYPSASDKPFTTEAGVTVTAALDTIKNKLGNYEQYFDTEGKYFFKPIDNYLTEGSPAEDIVTALADSYLYKIKEDLSVYSLRDSKIVTAYTNAPQYNQIKNDFMVIGKDPDSELPLRYHIALERGIQAGESRYWQVVMVKDKDKDIMRAYSAVENSEDYNVDCGDNYRLKKYLTIIRDNDQTAFGKEIREEFPKMFNLETLEWKFDPKGAGRDGLLYWFDILDTRSDSLPTDVSQFGVETIGRRTKVLKDDAINCLFTPKYPDLQLDGEWVFGTLSTDGTFTEDGAARAEIEDKILEGITKVPAIDYLRAALHQYLSYNESITINAVPIYHLDVNQIIYVENNESDIQGNYIIESISYPLNFDGLMTINAKKLMTMV